MVPPDLVDYIREQTSSGVPAQDVRAALMEAGWNEHDVENALHDVAAGLEPLTSGASLHEDVAQVRGMVSHLASRVQRLEARLTSAGQLTAPAELGAGTGAPERELPAGRGSGVVMKAATALAAVALLATYGRLFQSAVTASDTAPVGLLQGAGLAGFLLLLGAWRLMRRHPWGAQVFVASAVAVWAVAAWHAWRTYHYMEASTAAAIGVLLVVILLVIGRWIDRYKRR